MKWRSVAGTLPVIPAKAGIGSRQAVSRLDGGHGPARRDPGLRRDDGKGAASSPGSDDSIHPPPESSRRRSIAFANMVIHRLIHLEHALNARENKPRNCDGIPSNSHEIPKNGMKSPSLPMPVMLSTGFSFSGHLSVWPASHGDANHARLRTEGVCVLGGGSGAWRSTTSFREARSTR